MRIKLHVQYGFIVKEPTSPTVRPISVDVIVQWRQIKVSNLSGSCSQGPIGFIPLRSLF